MPMSSTLQSAKSLLILFALLLTPSIAAAERFPAQVEIDGLTLTRNGVGLCEWGFFEINLYHAALWLEVPCSNPEAILASGGVKHLELEFCRKLSKKQMRKAYQESFKVNATEAEKTKYAAAMNQFLDALKRQKKKTRLSMTHLPGRGLILKQGTETLGPIGDDGFANLLFRLYVGPKPPTKQLRRQLLGKHAMPESLLLPRPKKEEAAAKDAAKEEKPSGGAEKKKTPAPKEKTPPKPGPTSQPKEKPPAVSSSAGSRN